MPKLTIEIDISDEQLEKSIEFVHGRTDYIEQIKKDYFSQEVIKIDMDRIPTNEEKRYHTNGLVAILITLQDTQHVAS